MQEGFWGGFGRLWGGLGSFGSLKINLGATFGRLWETLGDSGGGFGETLGGFGELWETLGESLGSLWEALGSFGEAFKAFLLLTPPAATTDDPIPQGSDVWLRCSSARSLKDSGPHAPPRAAWCGPPLATVHTRRLPCTSSPAECK